MQRIITFILFLFISISAFAQTDGITYQAVIIGPDELELPGVDSEGNYLPSTEVAIKFTILTPGTNIVHFTEVQMTTTDEFGRINLIIGAVEHDDFEKIEWDGVPKSLKVEIDFNGGRDFVDMSIEKLTFVPYAYHRNITATGTLIVDDNTTLRGELLVENLATNLGGTLNVNNGNATSLSGDLTVDGETNLNNNLNVNNKSTTYLSGELIVGDSLVGPPDGDLDAPTLLNGSLTVVGESTFTGLVADDLTINNSTELNGSVAINSDEQVKITSTLNGDELDINNYPLLVEGGNQGIAIRVNADGAVNNNNFVSFWDETPVGSVTPFDVDNATGPIQDILDIVGLDSGFIDDLNGALSGGANTVSGVTLPDTSGPMLWGRIEGETNPDEFSNNSDYNLDRLGAIYDVVDGALDLSWQIFDNLSQTGDVTAAVTSSTPCIGLGGCVTAPILSLIINESADSIYEGIKTIAAVANQVFAGYVLVKFDDNKMKFRGVSYASGAGDYAEYLPRLNINEKMSYGDIVGLNGGKVSKQTDGAQKMMVISFKPAVLGALPQVGEEQFYEKVAFMGQVPVKVFGAVNIGDYILPSGNNDGMGVAISPDKLTTKDIKNIVGVAWETSESKFGYNLINTAVGINNNDNNPIVERLEKEVLDQKKEIGELKSLLLKTMERLDAIENNSSKVSKVSSQKVAHDEEHTIDVVHNGRNFDIEDEIIYYEITDDDIEQAFLLVEKRINNSEFEFTKSENFIWNKIKEDTDFKQNFIKKLKRDLAKQFHYHKEINKKSKH
ncbi:hypothetical protein MHTCC0001_11780 [Flavobacteriaceae bacterium MHTCC 0001]